MAGTNGGPMPTSPTGSLFNATQRVQRLETQFAEFATQSNADGRQLTNRVLQLEATLRQREEEIQQILESQAQQI